MACLDALEERVEALENEMSAVERCIKALVKGDSKITEMLDLLAPLSFMFRKPTDGNLGLVQHCSSRRLPPKKAPLMRASIPWM